MKRKQIPIRVLSLVLLISMLAAFVACGENNSGVTTSSSEAITASPTNPEESTTAETTAEFTTPEYNTSELTTPAQTTPTQTTPAQTTPTQTTPAQTTPAQTTPTQTTPAQTTPAQTTPAQTTPAQTTKPVVTTPQATTTSKPAVNPEPQATLIYYENFESFNLNNSSAQVIAQKGWIKDTTANGAYNNNTTAYSIRNNRGSNMLYLTNNTSSGNDSYLILLSSAQMGKYHEKNYTYQYDLIYTNASAADRYIVLLSEYNGKFYNSFHFRNRGTANNQAHNYGAWTTYDVSGSYYAPNTNSNSIVKKLLGKNYSESAQAFSDISISIRYVVDWQNGNSVYMRVNDAGFPGSGVWTLVSKGTSADSKNVFKFENGGAAIVLKTGGRQDGYVDNIIIWEGTGDEPKDKSNPLFTRYSDECSGHTWIGEGNCKDPYKCRYCGELKEELNHKFSSVTGTNDRICSVCSSYEKTAESNQLLTNLPLYDGGNKTQRLYESGHGMTDDKFSKEAEAYMQIISSTSESEFKAYLSKLKDYGFKETYNYSCDGNLYAQYLKDDNRVYLYYTASAKEVRIIEDFHSKYSPSEFGYTYEKKAGDTTVLYQYGVPMNSAGLNISKNDEGKIDCGMMYVIKLADNSVFILDGGGYQQFDVSQIDGFMKFLYDVTGTPEGGKIRIAGWYISHGHSDHMAGFCLFVKKYSANLTLERIFHNFASANSPTSILATAGTSNFKKLISYVNTYFADDSVKYIKIHTGQVINLADIKINVIYTHEDIVSPSSGLSEVSNDYNNSSSVIYIEFDGKELAFLGDINRPAMSVIIANNSAETLKCDMIQLAHHVINDLSELYKITMAPVVLVPQSPNGATLNATRKRALNAAKVYLKDDMLYYASEETVGISVVDGEIKKVFTDVVHGGKYTGWSW